MAWFWMVVCFAVAGAMPARLLESRLTLLELGGIPHPKVSQGSFGVVARAVRATATPVSESYMIRQELKGM